MGKFLVRRLLISIPTVLGVITVVFIALRLLPGDPAVVILGDYAEEGRLRELRSQLGIDKPILVQYLTYMGEVMRGDLGDSLFSRQEAMVDIRQFFPYTLQLTLAGLFIAVVVGVPLGIISAVMRNSWLDHISRLISMVGVSMPPFWLGLVLMWVFSLNLRWLPFSGGGDMNDPGSWLKHLILPATVLGLGSAALIARMTRSCMLEVLTQEYVRTARAKGLHERGVILKHAMQNALIPVITVVGLQLGVQLGGAVTIESVFARPGLGKLLFDSLERNDYSQAQACLLVFSLCLIVVNILTDVIYSLVDPRVRTS